MRALVPLVMAVLFLIGFTMGDDVHLLNAYELVRVSSGYVLPRVGSHFIADQAKLGQAALPAAWALWLLSSMLASFVVAKVWSLCR